MAKGRKCFTEIQQTGFLNLSNGENLQASTKKILGTRIRRYRLRKKFQQDELAELIGVSSKAVSSWEVGLARPDLDNLVPICRALDITPSQLLGYSGDLTEKERELLNRYRGLIKLDREIVDTLVHSLSDAHEIRKAEKTNLVRIKSAFNPLVAGIGLSEEWDTDCETLYVHDSKLAREADYVFRVQGDSMEPTFHSGDRVFVSVINQNNLLPGMIGAFQYENSTYIKEYTEEGLRSHNPKYSLMSFDEDTQVLLIGKVIGVLPPDEIATQEEIDLFTALEND